MEASPCQQPRAHPAQPDLSPHLHQDSGSLWGREGDVVNEVGDVPGGERGTGQRQTPSSLAQHHSRTCHLPRGTHLFPTAASAIRAAIIHRTCANRKRDPPAPSPPPGGQHGSCQGLASSQTGLQAHVPFRQWHFRGGQTVAPHAPRTPIVMLPPLARARGAVLTLPRAAGGGRRRSSGTGR